MKLSKAKIVFFIFFLLLTLAGAYTYFIHFEGNIHSVQLNVASTASGEKPELQFTVDQTLLKVLIKEYESLTRTIRITNTDDKDLSFTLETSHSVSDLIKLSETEFVLPPGQTKNIETSFVSVSGGVEYKPGTYSGELIVTAGGVSRRIPVIIEIESRNVLFDTNLNIKSMYKRVNQGDELLVGIKVYNLQGNRPTSINMEYNIKDLESNTVVTESESVVVATQADFLKSFTIPSNLQPGVYIFNVNTKYGSSVGTSSYLFEVPVAGESPVVNIVSRCTSSNSCLFGGFALVIVSIISLMFLRLFSMMDKSKLPTKIDRSKIPVISPRQGIIASWRQQRRVKIAERQRIIREKIAEKQRMVREKIAEKRRKTLERQRLVRRRGEGIKNFFGGIIRLPINTGKSVAGFFRGTTNDVGGLVRYVNKLIFGLLHDIRLVRTPAEISEAKRRRLEAVREKERKRALAKRKRSIRSRDLGKKIKNIFKR